MEKLSTINLPEAGQGGGVKKTLQPENTVVKVNSLSLDKTPFTDESWNLNLHMEGEPLEGFEGFWVDKQDESKGRHLGQVARVRASQYAYKDGLIGNTQIFKDREILKFLKSFCEAMGNPQWLIDQNDRHDTIQSMIDQLNKDKPFKDVWMNACLAGKTYIREGYVNYDLYLPRFTAVQVPLEKKGTTPSKLIKFNEELHILKPKAKVAAKDGAADFEL